MRRYSPQKLSTLLLMESPVGFALFKLLDKEKLFQAEDLTNEFSTPDSARKVVKLKAFSKFGNMSEALTSATSLIDGEPSEALSNFLLENFKGDMLGVSDPDLGRTISRNLSIKCVYNTPILELMRGLRTQLPDLISDLTTTDMVPMSLGLSSEISRYKLKFSPDKAVDEVPTTEEKPSKRKTKKKEKKQQQLGENADGAKKNKKRKHRETDREDEEIPTRMRVVEEEEEKEGCYA